MSSPQRPQYLYRFPSTGDAVRPQGEGDASGLTILLLIGAGLGIPALIAYGLGTLQEMQVLGILLGVLGVIGILARPFLGLIFFVALLYTRPEESIPALDGMHFTLMVAVVTLLGLAVKMVTEKQPMVRTPLNGMMLGFGFAAVLSSVSGGDMAPALMDIGRLILLVFLILNLTRTPERYNALVTALLLFSVYLALYSLYLFYMGDTVAQDGGLRSKATGIFADPNDLAATFVAGIALAIMRVIQTRGLLRVGYGALLGILLYATIVANSRGGLLALMLVIGVYCLTARMPRSKKAGLIALMVVLFLALAGGRMSNFDTEDASANSRFWFWSRGYELLLEHPLTGIGYNQFQSENGGMTAHNSFVLCFAELGITGYFFFMGAIYYCFKREDGRVDVPVPTDRQMQDLFAARVALAAYLSASFWLSHTYTPTLYVFLALPIAAPACYGPVTVQGSLGAKERRRDWGKIALLALSSIYVIQAMAAHYR